MVGFLKYESYKDSGNSWVQEIPTNWNIERAKWLFKRMDRRVRKKDEVVTAFRDGEVTLRKNRREEGFTTALQEHGYQGIRKGDLVIHAMDAFAGAIGVSDSDGKSTPVYSVCTPRSEFYVNSYYYVYLLRYMARSGFIQSLAKGIRERSTDFRFNDFANLFLPIPSPEEQNRIVEFLDRKTAEIDQAIAQKQHLIELLQEQKAILINQAVTKGLDPNVPMCDRGVDWIGKIPTHWQLDKVKHLTTKVGSGITPRGGGENYIDEGVLFIRSQNVYFDELRLDDAVYISEKTHNLMSNTSVCVGDVLLNITGASIGRNCVFRGESSKANVNQHVCIIRPNLKIRPWYLSYLFESRLGQEQIWLSQNGASREGLNFADLKTFVFPLPTIEEQKEIEKEIFKILETIKETINSIEKEKKALREFGSCLITSAVTGKIKV